MLNEMFLPYRRTLISQIFPHRSSTQEMLLQRTRRYIPGTSQGLERWNKERNKDAEFWGQIYVV
jgi:hypothetical protein